MQACLNKTADELPDPDALAEALRPQLYKTFKPAFLGRMKVVPYYPISDDVLAEIIELKLERIRRRIEANHKAAFEWDDRWSMRCWRAAPRSIRAPATSTIS
jgi:type VI secretion system protein VasG